MTPWHLKFTDGREAGPYCEDQIRKAFADGTIDATSQIRQGASDWIAADRVRDMFARLQQEGFYLKFVDGEVHGPYTQPRVRAMQAACELPALFWIRHRAGGTWNRIESPPQPNCEAAARPPSIGSSNPTNAPNAVNAATVAFPTESVTATPEADELAIPDDVPLTPGFRPLVESAPVMKLRRNDWQTRWTCLCDRVTLALCGIQLKPNDDAKAA